MLDREILVVGFDWDGTLVGSMALKADKFASSMVGFYPVLQGEEHNIRDLYLATRGTPRTSQLALVQERYELDVLSDGDLQAWSDCFTESYIHEKPALFPDVIPTMDTLIALEFGLFISSSVPHDDLVRTLRDYPLNGYFNPIFGTQNNSSFRKGLPHFSQVAKELRVDMSQMAFVGDGQDDIYGAQESGMVSIGKADPSLPGSLAEMQEAKLDLIIRNLEEIIPYLTS